MSESINEPSFRDNANTLLEIISEGGKEGKELTDVINQLDDLLAYRYIFNEIPDILIQLAQMPANVTGGSVKLQERAIMQLFYGIDAPAFDDKPEIMIEISQIELCPDASIDTCKRAVHLRLSRLIKQGFFDSKPDILQQLTSVTEYTPRGWDEDETIKIAEEARDRLSHIS